MNLNESLNEPNDAGEMSEEQKRLYLVWEGSYYSTGEVTENGSVVGRLGPPPTIAAWWRALDRHLSQLWFDCENEWLAMHVKEQRGPDAYNPQLIPLKEIATARGAFNLSDPLTYLVWLDFIGRYPERGEAWNEFERAHGTIETLSFFNA